jgi:uncharacterized protein YgiM (DUF1202 family)
MTHVIIRDTKHYRAGPQQQSPPDGTLKAGTKVKLLSDQGSYSSVVTEDGTETFVSTSDLKKLEPDGRRGAPKKAL